MGHLLKWLRAFWKPPTGFSWLNPPRVILLWLSLFILLSLIFPAFPSILKGVDLLHQRGGLGTALSLSLRRMVMGYGIVAVVGILGGLLIGKIPLFDQLLGSLAVAVNAIPGAAWVPISIILFGMTERAVVFTIVLGATGIVMVNTDTGIREVPPLLARAAKTLGANDWLKYFLFVQAPSAIPRVVDGLRLAWAFGWRALMAGELLTSVNGLGGILSATAKAGRSDELLALMCLVASIGILVDGYIFKWLEYRVKVQWGLA